MNAVGRKLGIGGSARTALTFEKCWRKERASEVCWLTLGKLVLDASITYISFVKDLLPCFLNSQSRFMFI